MKLETEAARYKQIGNGMWAQIGHSPKSKQP
jgi:hypothetical protein